MINKPGLHPVEKGIWHVNKYIRFSNRYPDPSRAPHRADDPLKYRRNNWFCLDADRPSDRTSRFEANRWALEILHLPVSSFRRTHSFDVMFLIQTAPKGDPMNTLSRFLVAAIAISAFLFVSRQEEIERHFSGRFLTYPLLQPGEKIDDMAITTGVEDAFPLSAFCSATKENDHSMRVDCGELSVCANVAIGQPFGVIGLIHAMNLIPQPINWEELVWEMSVDGHPIDLEAFGVHDIVYPDLAHSPSPVREVFKMERLWNVVLVNPTPGLHRVQGQAQTRDGAATYTWVVNFTVATP
jgi:hypothetical protein